jgi:hypothetical protein
MQPPQQFGALYNTHPTTLIQQQQQFRQYPQPSPVLVAARADAVVFEINISINFIIYRLDWVPMSVVVAIAVFLNRPKYANVLNRCMLLVHFVSQPMVLTLHGNFSSVAQKNTLRKSASMSQKYKHL